MVQLRQIPSCTQAALCFRIKNFNNSFTHFTGGFLFLVFLPRLGLIQPVEAISTPGWIPNVLPNSILSSFIFEGVFHD